MTFYPPKPCRCSDLRICETISSWSPSSFPFASAITECSCGFRNFLLSRLKPAWLLAQLSGRWMGPSTLSPMPEMPLSKVCLYVPSAFPLLLIRERRKNVLSGFRLFVLGEILGEISMSTVGAESANFSSSCYPSKDVFVNSFLTTASAVPGFAFAIAFMDRLGRKVRDRRAESK